jgi:very-short-patch-repair endonuclease
MRTFWTTAELLALGKTEREIRTAVRTGRLHAVRKGHLAVPGAAGEVVRAVRIGGVATATTAARAMGLWVPPDPVPASRDAFGRRRDRAQRLHVAVPNTASRLRDPDDPRRPLVPTPAVVVHWTEPEELAGTAPMRLAPPLVAVRHAFLSLPPEHALAVLDSALHHRFLRTRDLHALAAALPAHLRPVVFAADGLAESGTETIARHLLRLLGLHVEAQVEIAGLGRVDLLVEGRLIVELDGREWHDEEDTFEDDRRRDLLGAAQRYRTLRFSWYQVLFRWHEVEAAVLAALAG